MCQLVYLPKGHDNLESYLSSLALEEDYLLPNTSSDSKPSVTSSKIRTVSVSCKPGSPTASSTMHQSGMTREHSTGVPGEGKSTSFREVFLANHFPLPASRRLSRMNEIAGLTPFALSERLSRNGAFWKTYPDYCLIPTATSGSCSKTWPRAGMMSHGKCYRRQSWERRINAIGSGLWPTPTASDWRDWNYTRGCGTHSPRLPIWLKRRYGNWPTVRLYAWMLTYPDQWTECEPLAMGKFQSWLQQHGIS